jgi:hypothetical protein
LKKHAFFLEIQPVVRSHFLIAVIGQHLFATVESLQITEDDLPDVAWKMFEIGGVTLWLFNIAMENHHF